ncbi:MAG: hypothetical protein AB1349_12685, partial [Elusimicrobiota bacterium]
RNIIINILKNRSIEYYEKYRGIITDIAVRMTASSNLASFFIGDRKLANRYPDRIDYDMIHHQCVDCYEYFKNLYEEGVIGKNDLKYREKLVLALLPRAIFRDIPHMSKEEIIKISDDLWTFFSKKIQFWFISLPLLLLARFNIAKMIYSSIYKLKHLLVG